MKHPKGCEDVMSQEWKGSADNIAFLMAPTIIMVVMQAILMTQSFLLRWRTDAVTAVMVGA